MNLIPASLAVALKNATRLAIVGDSIAYGRSDPNGGWAHQLAQAHISRDEMNNRLYNLAIPGRTLAGMHQYAPTEVATRKVDTVIISAGINDLAGVEGPITPAQLLIHLQHLCAELEDAGRRIVLFTPLWLNCIAAQECMNFSVDITEVKEYRNLLLTWAKETNHTTFDLWPILKNQPERFTDGVHPDPVGHQLIWQALQQSMEQSTLESKKK
ncbi:MAG: SGNH/GDSL hydrolase family protein [Rothia sp. (in: high G+C Gram-positive bacteria)]|nr:SGNH/GDSL hydrolase family protein [Rothia sp. (in: high G+C Gram-positive bacteria)]